MPVSTREMCPRNDRQSSVVEVGEGKYVIASNAIGFEHTTTTTVNNSIKQDLAEQQNLH